MGIAGSGGGVKCGMRPWVLKILFPILIGIGIVLGLVMVYISLKKPPTPPILFPPPSPPFAHVIAADGIVEASSENILIGTPFSEIVEEVYVVASDQLEAGEPLFKLNTDQLEAQSEEAKRGVEVAEKEYQKLLDLPRPEDVPIREALVGKTNALWKDRIAQYDLIKKIENPKAVSRDEFNQKKYQEKATQYEYEQSVAELNLLLAGAWIRDLEISRAQLKEAKARQEVIEAQINLSTVKAPFKGVVLRVNIHVGEFAQASELQDPLILFGNIDPLHIRIDIDEEEVWRVIPGAPGEAYMRGNSSIKASLDFVRLEPFLTPKEFLTGDSRERVDTRVLQLIYEFPQNGVPIYPGMIMDVFLEGKPYSEERE
ncbi:MAG: hypothetical protein K940chlam9_00048 [Chlamydiae bacterium]|nr:hypothetical protein [Chlamydiota bacterium]